MFFAVYSKDAAVISVASSQVERTKPPIPRADLYFFAFSGSSTIDFQASIGLLDLEVDMIDPNISNIE